MQPADALQQELEHLGLSSREAQIYLLLVVHKELSVQDIATASHVPRTSVYSSLKRLYELGIAEEIIDDHFKKIRPYPLSILRHSIDDKMSALEQLAQSLQELEQAVELTPQLVHQQATVTRFYKHRSGARQLLWNTLKAADTVYVYSEWGRSRYVGKKFYERFVLASHERKIRERVLINPTPVAIDSIRRFNLQPSSTSRTKVADIRVLPESNILIKGETFIYNDVYAQIYLQNIEINGFEIESQDFATTQRSIFETLWATARPVTDFLK